MSVSSSLFDALQLSAQFPNTDRIYEIDTGARILQVTELHEGGVYVLSDRSKYLPVDYMRPNEGPLLHIRVLRCNTKSIGNARGVTLTQRHLESMAAVRAEVARAMGMYTVYELFTYSGHPVTTVAELVEGKLYVALKDDETFAARPEFDKRTFVLAACLMSLTLIYQNAHKGDPSSHSPLAFTASQCRTSTRRNESTVSRFSCPKKTGTISIYVVVSVSFIVS